MVLRELLGSLHKVIARAKVNNTTIDEKLVREELGDKIEEFALDLKNPVDIEESSYLNTVPEIPEELNQINIADLLETLILDWNIETARLETQL